MTDKEIKKKETGYEDLLATWYGRSHLLIKCHHNCAGILERKHYWLGVPAIVISTIVGTAVFATLEKNPALYIQIIVGLASMLTAVLMTLQTFLRYNERADKHRIAGVRYGAIMQELEQALVLPPKENELIAFIESIRRRWKRLGENSPNISQKIWNEANNDTN